MSWLLSPRHWPHIPEMTGLIPCGRLLESWSWHSNVFQTFLQDSKLFGAFFLSMSSVCGFLESRVLSFTPRKVGVSTWCSVLSPSFMVIFFFGGVEGEQCGLCLHFTYLETPAMCLLICLVHSFLDPVSRRCGVFRRTSHSEIICM